MSILLLFRSCISSGTRFLNLSWYKKTLFILFAARAFSSEECCVNPENSFCCDVFECLTPTCQAPCSMGILVSSSFLYWQPQEDGLDFVIQSNDAVSLGNEAKVHRMDFDWNPGFRVLLGYQFPKQMTVASSWTHYLTEGTESLSPETGVLFSVWSLPVGGIPPLAFETKASAKTHLSLNIVDLGVSAPFTPRSFLELSPSIDLSSVWLHQEFNIHLSGGPGINGFVVQDDHITMKNNSWGIGPKVGIGTLWHCGNGFGVVGNFSLSLLYTFFKVSQNEQATFAGLTPSTTYLDIDENSFHVGCLNFDFFLGIRWETLFCTDWLHFLVEAGWENIIFLGQNQLMRFPSHLNNGMNSTSQGAVSFQGLTARAAITF